MNDKSMNTSKQRKLCKNKKMLYIKTETFEMKVRGKKQTVAQWNCHQQNPSFPPNIPLHYIWATA